jgi:predicted outer membrane repeat protein
MEGGSINGNTSAGAGGALALIDNCVFTMLNGEIGNNTSGEYGGAVAADHTASLALWGGSLRGNSAGMYGGGIFASGVFFKSPESLCMIYGNDAAEEDANSARQGSAVYISRDGYGDMAREESAGRDVLLDSGAAGAAGGWRETLTPEVEAEPDAEADVEADAGAEDALSE